jgi:signal transduction histidine kinase
MTALDHGPFVRDRLSDSLMFLQVFMAVIAITFLVIAALGSEVSVRERARQKALATMRVAREQAESASAFKSTLLGVVSHELRTPLASLQLQIERLRLEGEAPPTAGPLLDRMFAQTKRLQNLIESMLTYARIESGRLATQLKEIDALAVARWCVEELRPQAESKDLSLEVVPQEGEVLLVSDPEIVHLVVANLLGNAIKFTEAGSVTIAVSATERGCRIRVTDSGPGIPEEERERIFEPFAQLRPARHKHLAGVGLGLALVRALVHALGGRVTLEPASGRGASFVVDLPGSVPLRASGSMAALGSAQRDGTSGNA